MTQTLKTHYAIIVTNQPTITKTAWERTLWSLVPRGQKKDWKFWCPTLYEPNQYTGHSYPAYRVEPRAFALFTERFEPAFINDAVLFQIDNACLNRLTHVRLGFGGNLRGGFFKLADPDSFATMARMALMSPPRISVSGGYQFNNDYGMMQGISKLLGASETISNWAQIVEQILPGMQGDLRAHLIALSHVAQAGLDAFYKPRIQPYIDAFRNIIEWV